MFKYVIDILKDAASMFFKFAWVTPMASLKKMLAGVNENTIGAWIVEKLGIEGLFAGYLAAGFNGAFSAITLVAAFAAWAGVFTTPLMILVPFAALALIKDLCAQSIKETSLDLTALALILLTGVCVGTACLNPLVFAVLGLAQLIDSMMEKGEPEVAEVPAEEAVAA